MKNVASALFIIVILTLTFLFFKYNTFKVIIKTEDKTIIKTYIHQGLDTMFIEIDTINNYE